MLDLSFIARLAYLMLIAKYCQEGEMETMEKVNGHARYFCSIN